MNTLDYTKESPYTQHQGLRRFSKTLVIATLFLVFAGSLVTSTGSGLSVPDWPNTYGHFMFAFPLNDMVGGIFYEHGHRMIASIVGFLTLVMAIWIGLKEKRKWVKVLAFCALGAVMMQGLLGGMTVLFYLPTAISMSHAILAQTFFILTIIIAYSLSKERRLRTREVNVMHSQKFLKVAFFVTFLVYIQLFLGALMRHTGSGLAIPDFPKMGGAYLPSFDENTLNYINTWRYYANLDPVSLSQIWIHFAHRVGAIFVLASVVYLIIQAFRHQKNNARIMKTVIAMGLIVILQLCLGIFTVLSVKQIYITSFHVVTGASLLGLSVLLILRSWPVKNEH